MRQSEFSPIAALLKVFLRVVVVSRIPDDPLDLIFTFRRGSVVAADCGGVASQDGVASAIDHELMDFLAVHGQTFEQAAVARQEAGGDHNRRKTPLFAGSIGRRAMAKAAAK